MVDKILYAIFFISVIILQITGVIMLFKGMDQAVDVLILSWLILIASKIISLTFFFLSFSMVYPSTFDYLIDSPPSIAKIAPVVQEDSSEAKKRIERPTSSGVPIRPIG